MRKDSRTPRQRCHFRKYLYSGEYDHLRRKYALLEMAVPASPFPTNIRYQSTIWNGWTKRPRTHSCAERHKVHQLWCLWALGKASIQTSWCIPKGGCPEENEAWAQGASQHFKAIIHVTDWAWTSYFALYLFFSMLSSDCGRVYDKDNVYNWECKRMFFVKQQRKFLKSQ